MDIEEPSEKDMTNSSRLRSQFLQSLIDNLRMHFPADDWLQAGAVLDPTTWPDDDVQKALYGDQELVRLAKLCRVDGRIAVDEYRQHKYNI